jgi:organic hydroperoxide reductase OsmC/OhrA
MHSFPHQYRTDASAKPEGVVTVSAPGLPDLVTTPPPEFDGPEGYWSPETLLVAAVADCFILTFRGIAKASRFEWLHLDCEATGLLERVDRITRFTEFQVTAKLHLPAGSDVEKAERLLEKAEHGCLITNSFIAETKLTTEISVESGELSPDVV